MQKIKVIELFAGYGSQHLALKRLKRNYPNFDYEVVAFCEIDKYAIKAYQALHGDNIPNLGDITKVNPFNIPDCDLMTWSFPCQSISSAGLQHGFAEGSGTRSSLCWDAMRIFKIKRPKYLLMENVSNLVSQKFINDFNKLQSALQDLGYTNFSALINSKDMGVPQNRLRIFMVSILDCPRAYYFPKPFKLERRLKDVLEQNVDERYYLKEEQVQKLIKSIENDNDIQRVGRYNNGQSGLVYGTEGVSPTVDASAPEHGRGVQIAEPQINTLGNLYDNNEQAGRIYDANGISPTLDNMASGGNKYPKIVEPTIASMKSRDKDNPTGVRTANNGNFAQRLEPSADQSTSNTITSVAKDNLLIEPSVLTPVRTEYGKAIRKQYGDNNLPESRHNLTQLQPKQDGTSNTLTSVAKDNLILEQIVLNCCKDGTAAALKSENMRASDKCITDPTGGFAKMGVMEITKQNNYDQTRISEGVRIRRLTERELFRLMDVEEPDIDTLLNADIAKTQLAKLAGNSIVVACLYYIFDRLFVHTEAEAGTQTTLF